MNKKCSKYTLEQISNFVDNELSENEQQAVLEHLKECSACEALARQYRSMSDLFSTHTDKQLAGIDPEIFKTRLSSLTVQEADTIKTWSFGSFFTKNIYLKLASIAAIVVISLVGLNHRFTRPAGPSAIVNSVDADTSSVMIIETEKEKHTIIWFSET